MTFHVCDLQVPNAAGILLGGIQLLVYFIYDKKSSSSKSAEMAVEEGSIDIVKEGIDVEKLGDVDGAKIKSQSLRNDSLSRQYSLKQVIETRSALANGARANPPHESDVENGGIH